MNHFDRLFAKARGCLIAATLALAMMAPTVSALALDRITLKDGNKVVEGTIVRELNGSIFFKYVENGVEKQVRFSPEQIAKIERDVKPAEKAQAPAPAPATTPANTPSAIPAATVPAPAGTTDATGAAAGAAAGTGAAASGSKTPKAVVITLGDRDNGDMVGMYFTAHTLREIIPSLEKTLGTDRSGVVVFRIYSGGGSAWEVPKLHAVLRNEYMKRWRTVAWVESSISAAAMTPHCLDEIYFTSQANYGACTMFSGRLKMSKGTDLESVLALMEKVSREAGYDYRIMRSMQIPDPLSATVHPDGRVEFFADETSGDILVNRAGEILTLNAVTAAQIKFSKGTADTLEELTKLMGYKELDWVGEKVPGIGWPVSKEERAQMNFRKKTKLDEQRVNEYIRRYQTAVEVAGNLQNRDDRAKAVGKARQALEEIKRMVANNPAFLEMSIGMDQGEYKQWLEEQEKLLRELMK